MNQTQNTGLNLAQNPPNFPPKYFKNSQKSATRKRKYYRLTK